MQKVGGYGENQFRQYAGQNVWNLNGYNVVQNVKNQVAQNSRVQNVGNQNGQIGALGNANLNGNGNLVAARAEGNAAEQDGNQIRCYNCWGVEEFDLMAAAADLDEIKEVNANCILMDNLQQATTSGTQTNRAPVYDSDGSAQVHDYENCDDNEIFNMFTQEEKYTELLEPNPEQHQVPQNDNNVISENPRVQNVRNQNGLIGVQGNGNQNGNLMAAHAEGNAGGQNGNQIRCYNCRGVGHYARNCTARPRRRDAAYLQTQLLIAQKEEAGIQLQVEEYDLMAAAADLDEIEKVNANCILMANLKQASTSGTQTDSAPVYDSDESAEVHENCDDNKIFNMFTQEEQYTELLEPILESHQVPHNDNDVISEDTSVEQGGEAVEQHPANFEETHALYESLY
nr:hypothetical protein [Tanacetum cinerariifolium]